MTQSVPWTSIWITGASTGIGRELALTLARAGAKVAVSARSREKLDEIAGLAPGVLVVPLDVTDQAATALAFAKIEANIGPLDLVILNAGVWHPMGAASFDAQKSANSMAVNYQGIANALELVMRAMIARGRGHIAMTSSVAGYRGLPQAAAYAPSKAAVISLAETLAPELKKKGITVTVINPGFVDTPMTKVNDFPMPFLMTTAGATQAIIDGLRRKKFEIAFPWQMVVLLKIARVLPYPLYFWFASTFLSPKRKN
ncbi:MAG: oxidoreductase [Hyphomicrobium sp.]|nr:MAG: oxidoreductase [Hyphomicrobium sp.]